MDPRIGLPLAIGNLVFIGYQFFFNWSNDFTYGNMFVGLLIGLVAAGIVYGIMATMNKG